MFRKPDQDLFARIFDEGQTGDAGMEWLRDGLKDLRDVPVHGLSNERLRDRVLGTGLTPVKSPSAPWWTWAWAPVAAAAIAVVVLPRLRSNPAPTVILNPPITTVAMNDFGSHRITPKLDPSRLGMSPVDSTEDFDVQAVLAEAARLPDFVEPKPTFASARTSRAPSLKRSSPGRPHNTGGKPLTLASLDSYGIGDPEASGTVPGGPSARRQEGSGVEAFKAAPTADAVPRQAMALMAPSADPLVVLAPEIDAATGAATATEVDSPTNISIGG